MSWKFSLWKAIHNNKEVISQKKSKFYWKEEACRRGKPLPWIYKTEESSGWPRAVVSFASFSGASARSSHLALRTPEVLPCPEWLSSPVCFPSSLMELVAGACVHAAKCLISWVLILSLSSLTCSRGQTSITSSPCAKISHELTLFNALSLCSWFFWKWKACVRPKKAFKGRLKSRYCV